ANNARKMPRKKGESRSESNSDTQTPVEARVQTVGQTAGQASRMKSRLFWGVGACALAIDVMTKAIAEYTLVPAYTPHELLGEFLRLTLAYNPGAAFSLYFGEYSR